VEGNERARIDSLLYRLRAWVRGDTPVDAAELAQKYHLDPMIVKRLAETEGVQIADGGAQDDRNDPDTDTRATQTIDIEELRRQTENSKGD
jgi:hypothetical protein